MQDEQPTEAEAAAFWNGLGVDERRAFVSWEASSDSALVEKAKAAGMVLSPAVQAHEAEVAFAEEGVGPATTVTPDPPSAVFARQLVLIADKGDTGPVSPLPSSHQPKN